MGLGRIQADPLCSGAGKRRESGLAAGAQDTEQPAWGEGAPGKQPLAGFLGSGWGPWQVHREGSSLVRDQLTNGKNWTTAVGPVSRA